MNRLWVFFSALCALVFFALPAAAERVQLEGGCEFRGGADCKASCTDVSFEAICNFELAASCKGQCTASAQVSCTNTCQGSCEGGM
jgi:hypothetical protein